MDTTHLRTWLGLPPGPWPPDDRELLGFGLERVSPAEVEVRALEQMEKLRPHQLVQPDLVTEGMNRLAQALIALTAPGVAGQSADGPTAPQQAPPPPKPKRHRRPHRTPKPATDGPPDEPVLEAEPVAAEAVAREPGLFLPPEPLTDPLIRDEVPRPQDARRVRPVGLPRPARRRAAYAALARLRALLRGLDDLRPFYADPSEQLLTPLRVFGYISAVRTFRAALDREPDEPWPAGSGQRVLAVVRHPLSIALFRDLVPTQRQALAADWAMAVEELRDESDALRQYLRLTRKPKPIGKELQQVNTWLRENPEWLLGSVLAAGFLVAVVRTALRVAH